MEAHRPATANAPNCLLVHHEHGHRRRSPNIPTNLDMRWKTSEGRLFPVSFPVLAFGDWRLFPLSLQFSRNLTGFKGGNVFVSCFVSLRFLVSLSRGCSEETNVLLSDELIFATGLFQPAILDRLG